MGYYQSPTIRTIYNCFRHKSAHLKLPKIFFTFKAAVLLKYGLVKISSGPKFNYSWQLHSHTFKGLGNRDHIETSQYIQEILTSVWTLYEHKNKLLRLLLSKLWGLFYAQSAWKVSALRVWLFWGSSLAAPSSYIKLVKAVYRQRIYYYLVQFSGMLHFWLQRYHVRIRTLGSSLVDMCIKVRNIASLDIFQVIHCHNHAYKSLSLNLFFFRGIIPYVLILVWNCHFVFFWWGFGSKGVAKIKG